MQTNILLRDNTSYEIEESRHKLSIGLFDVKVWFFNREENLYAEKFESLSAEDIDNIVAECLVTTMQKLDIYREVNRQEQLRIAKKVMESDLINGYVIKKIYNDRNSDFEVRLLKNGRFFASVVVRNFGRSDIVSLRRKLDNIISNNIDIINLHHSIRLCEIVKLIEKY